MPGIFECSGVRHSAAMMFSLLLVVAAAARDAGVERLDQVAKVPGLPTLPFAHVARAFVEIAGDRDLAGQRVLVTTEKGGKASVARPW